MNFPHHTVILDHRDLCNLLAERERLLQLCRDGRRTVVYGRRNTGKTSIMRSVLIPELRKQNRHLIVLYADLYGVRRQEQLAERVRHSFANGMRDAFPVRTALLAALETLKRLRPKLTLDPNTGETGLSFDANQTEGVSLEVALEELGELHRRHGALLILDEFQDIALMKDTEAVQGELRKILELLPQDLPIVLLGSKKHLLGRIFAKPDAPFYAWGSKIEMPEISLNDYFNYMAPRFAHHGLAITCEVAAILTSKVRGNPEAINILCATLLSRHSRRLSGQKQIFAINAAEVDAAMLDLLIQQQSEFLETLTALSAYQKLFLWALARQEPLRATSSNEFVRSVGATAAGVRKIAKKFEDDAVIYQSPTGYMIENPLLSSYLKTVNRGEV